MKSKLFPLMDWMMIFLGRQLQLVIVFFISSLRYSNPNENAVYVYKLVNNGYEFINKIFPSDEQPGPGGALFGTRLLYNDGQLFVGAQNRKVNNIPVGALYLFEYENYNWVENRLLFRRNRIHLTDCFRMQFLNTMIIY